eukprot:10138741-Lingulodinium_polyedra.AAC.1
MATQWCAATANPAARPATKRKTFMRNARSGPNARPARSNRPCRCCGGWFWFAPCNPPPRPG